MHRLLETWVMKQARFTSVHPAATAGKLALHGYPIECRRVEVIVAMVEPVRAGAASADSVTEARVGALLNDYLDRRARGESITEDLLLTEHPEFADALAQHLNMLRALAPSHNAIEDLLAKKVLLPSSSPEYAAELGSYRIAGILGRGGMGIVLRAIETPLNRPVALKILRPELSVDRRALIRFEHEAKAAAALRHPNIVTVYACGACDGTHFLAMELIDGPSLADVLAREPALATDEIRRIFRELLEGLGAAHAAGLVHRDIKSSNILLDGPHRTVKIADFGLARITASNTRITMPQAAIGTPEYMSPEQARGDEDIDHRTDLYSAGVVLYEMLTRRVPFKGDSPSALIHAILNTDPPTPRSCQPSADRHLSRLSLRLMAKRREDRFASADEAMIALEKRHPFRVRWSWKARRRMRIAVVAALSVCGVSYFIVIRSGRMGTFVSEVRPGIGQENQATATIEARYGDELEWTRFYTFPDPQRGVTVTAVVYPEPGRAPIVLAGVRSATDNQSLFAFDATRGDVHSRVPLWSESVLMRHPWPDCESPTEFVVSSIVPSDCDGAPGQEVVLVAQDRSEYPGYIAILDPRSRRVVARYWHVGHLQHVKVAKDFLGPGRSAIIVVALNNKLDGFDRPAAADPKPVADFDWVPVLMVLDTRAMAGERLIDVPSARQRMPKLEPVLPYSYAFLNASVGETVMRIDRETGERRYPSENPADGEIVNLLPPQVVRCPAGSEAGLCIEIGMKHGPDNTPEGVQFTFDPDLMVTTFIANSSEPTGLNRAFWLARFHRLVIRGERVE